MVKKECNSRECRFPKEETSEAAAIAVDSVTAAAAAATELGGP